MVPVQLAADASVSSAQGRYFRINGGDGAQDLFQHSLIVERITAPWFDATKQLRKGA